MSLSEYLAVSIAAKSFLLSVAGLKLKLKAYPPSTYIDKELAQIRKLQEETCGLTELDFYSLIENPTLWVG